MNDRKIRIQNQIRKNAFADPWHLKNANPYFFGTNQKNPSKGKRRSAWFNPPNI